MNYKVDSGKLFEGLDEIVAKVVREGSVHVLKLKSTEQPNLYEIVGNTAVKADEPLLETQVLEGMTVRVKLEEAHQVIERYKEDLKKERARTAMYKEKYEDVLCDKDCMQEEYEDELRSKDEEIKKIRAQLEYAEKHPQSVTYVQNQHNHLEDNRSQVAVQEMKVESGGVGVQQKSTPKTVQTQQTDADAPHKFCEFIVKDAAYKQKYQTDEQFYEEFRLFFTNKTSPDVVAYLRRKEGDGILNFKSLKPGDIYDQLVVDLGKPKFDRATFVRNCSGWIPK